MWILLEFLPKLIGIKWLHLVWNYLICPLMSFWRTTLPSVISLTIWLPLDASPIFFSTSTSKDGKFQLSHNCKVKTNTKYKDVNVVRSNFMPSHLPFQYSMQSPPLWWNSLWGTYMYRKEHSDQGLRKQGGRGSIAPPLLPEME